jgi:hypothetical protein
MAKRKLNMEDWIVVGFTETFYMIFVHKLKGVVLIMNLN